MMAIHTHYSPVAINTDFIDSSFVDGATYTRDENSDYLQNAFLNSRASTIWSLLQVWRSIENSTLPSSRKSTLQLKERSWYIYKHTFWTQLAHTRTKRSILHRYTTRTAHQTPHRHELTLWRNCLRFASYTNVSHSRSEQYITYLGGKLFWR